MQRNETGRDEGLNLMKHRRGINVCPKNIRISYFKYEKFLRKQTIITGKSQLKIFDLFKGKI